MLDRAYEPMQVGPITLPNRFIKAGANENMSMAGMPTRAMLEHHRELAAGGVGMTTMAYLAVDKVGRTLPDQLWLNDDVVPELRAVTDAVHAAGGKIAAQITHGGSFVTGIFVPRRLQSSVSGFNPAGLLRGNLMRRAMNEADMDRMVDAFVRGAERCVAAGFDAVEIHMGHGYLLNQFLSPMDNQRRDAYGGSAENRARFPARVLAAVKQQVGERIAVLAKINVSDGRSRGATVEDATTARILEAAGADMLVLSGGAMSSPVGSCSAATSTSMQCCRYWVNGPSAAWRSRPPPSRRQRLIFRSCISGSIRPKFVSRYPYPWPISVALNPQITSPSVSRRALTL